MDTSPVYRIHTSSPTFASSNNPVSDADSHTLRSPASVRIDMIRVSRTSLPNFWLTVRKDSTAPTTGMPTLKSNVGGKLPPDTRLKPGRGCCAFITVFVVIDIFPPARPVHALVK